MTKAGNVLARDLANLRLGGRGEVDRNNEPFKSVIRRHHRARDITDEFSQAVKVLTTGQLIKDESFSLFESVQALEIMDPKMDSGYLEPGETLDDEYAITRSLLPTELVAIMDQLLCYEMSWYQGYPLAQNLFTSHHIDYILSQSRPEKAMPTFRQGYGGDEPDVLLEGVLKAYCVGVIKCCDIVIEMIAGQQYYEEEDFNTNTFNRRLLVDVDDDACMQLLNHAVRYLRQQKSTEIEPSVRDALITRLEMRRDLITTFLPNESISYTTKNWTRLADQVEDVMKSHGLGKPVPDAFSAKIQRRLASTAPPRPIADVKFEEACRQLKTLYTDLEEVLMMGRIWTDDASFPISNLMTTCLSLTNRPAPPTALSRAFLQTLLFAPGRPADSHTTNNLQALLLDALRETLPSPDMIDDKWWGIEVPSDWRYKLAQDIETFLNETAPIMENVLRALCQNPTRIRRCLTNVLAEVDALLTRLQARYNLSSNPLYPTPRQSSQTNLTQMITTSIFHYIHRLELQIAIWITTLGFEQDIYLAHEMSNMYCFLAHALTSLAKSHADHQNHTASYLSHTRARSRPTQHSSTTDIHSPRTAFATALQQVYAILNLLSPANKTSPYVKQNLQWELRMKPFSGLAHFSYPLASAPSSLSTTSLSDARKVLLEMQKLLEEAKTGFVTLLQLPITSSSTSSNQARANAMATAIALGAFGREEQWKKDVKSEMRSVVSAGLVVAKILAFVNGLVDAKGVVGGGAGGGASDEVKKEKKIRWRVEEVDDSGMRKGSGFGWWIVPVVEI